MKPPGSLTTLWTQIIFVIQTGGEEAANRALEQFCQQYRPIIHGFFRQKGCRHEQAEDYTQDFFASRIITRLKGGFLSKPNPEKGKFRFFLFHVLK